MHDPSRQRAGLILQQLDQLPTLPAVATRVLQLTSAHDSSAADVVKLIESDPALSARILQLVARGGSGVRTDAATIDRAVVLLGFEAVRAAVLAVSVFETFAGATHSAASKFDRAAFWTHCLAVACCAEALAREAATATTEPAHALEPSAAFLAGLLHDLGKIALDATLPKSFSRVVEAADLLRGDIAAVERNVIGLDHMVAGKRLCEKWLLPASVRDCVWLHGQAPGLLPATVADRRLVNLVTLADQLVREQHIGYSGNYLFSVPRRELLDAVGLTTAQADAVAARVIDQVGPRARALGLGQDNPSDLYRGALQQANRELGRMTEQLSAKNRKLTVKAKFFEALAAFQRELRPDAPPEIVLQAIGQTAAQVLETGRTVVFSLPPGRGYADVSLIGATEGVLHSTLVESTPTPTPATAENVDDALAAAHGSATAALPVALTRPAAGETVVAGVGEDLEWLMQAYSPKLAGDKRHWIALLADGVCVGGVVWGAPAGEAARLAHQTSELTALASGWSLALRTTQIRDESKALAEQLAEANHRLQAAHDTIVRSRMLTSVAEMAAGAAHEMNNPLAVISGRSQLLASTLADPKDKLNAKLIYDKSMVLSDLITELMHFAKPDPPVPAECEIAGVIAGAVAEARERCTRENTASPGIDPSIDVRVADVPFAYIDGRQVGQALVEILSNALHAAGGLGDVRVSCDFDGFGRKLVLTVSDDGPGMEEHTLRHATDPFFSAKTAGRRRGMGLSKAQRWVESSAGTLRIESRPGAGTHVILLLPATRPIDRAQALVLKQAK